MADLPTTNYGFIKPENGASADDWGVKWNINLDNIDTTLAGIAGAAEDAQEAAEDALQPGNALSELTATADTARTNIGAQASHANLTAFSALTGAAGKTPYFTGAGTMDMMTVSPQGRDFLTDTTAAAQRSRLGLRINGQGVWVQGGTPGSPQDGDIWVIV